MWAGDLDNTGSVLEAAGGPAVGCAPRPQKPPRVVHVLLDGVRGGQPTDITRPRQRSPEHLNWPSRLSGADDDRRLWALQV